MDAREELAQIIDAAFYEHEQGYYLNAESVEHAQADRVLAAGYRKMPDRGAIARTLASTDDYDGCFERVDEWEALEQWQKDAHPQESPDIDREDCEFWYRRADAILALMDGNK